MGGVTSEEGAHVSIAIKRLYEPRDALVTEFGFSSIASGRVDCAKDAADFDQWRQDLSPSTPLRKY